METAAQPLLPPSYEQVMATSRPTHILTTNTTTTTTGSNNNNNTLGLVPTSIGHFVDPNVPFYGDHSHQPQSQHQPPSLQPPPPPPPPTTATATFISTPVPYHFTPLPNSNFIMDPNMNSTPPIVPTTTTHFMGGSTASLIQDHQ